MTDVKMEVDYCNRCRCQFCGEYCATYQVHRWVPFSARGRMDSAWALQERIVEYSGDLRDTIYTCQLCRRCHEACSSALPGKIDIPETMIQLRNDIVTNHPELEPKVFRDLCKNIVKMGNVIGVDSKEKNVWAKKLNLRDSGPTVFWATCMNPLMGYFEVALKSSKKYNISMEKMIGMNKGFKKFGIDRIVRMLSDAAFNSSESYRQTLVHAVEILQHIGIDVGYLSDEPCCGLALHTYGHLDEFEKHSQKTFEHFQNKGVKEIIGLNPPCLTALRDEYPKYNEDYDLDVKHLLEPVAQKVQDGQLKLTSKQALKVTYHDPCYMTRYMNVIEQPRTILNNIEGVTLVETENAGKITNCCGGGGPEVKYSDISINMGIRRAKELLATDPDIILTSCPICLVMLKIGVEQAGSSVVVEDITDFIHRSLPV